jgi:hypothetical protein
MKLYTYGDGLHEPNHMVLEAAKTTNNGAGWSWDGAAAVPLLGRLSNGTASHPAHLIQQYTFPAATARYWRWVILDCHWDHETNRSHAMVEELEFHLFGSDPAVSGARFSAEVYTRGCHSSRSSTFLTGSHRKLRPNTEGTC